MKKKKIVLIACSLMILTIVVIGMIPSPLETTPHDFSGELWNTSHDKCIVCHLTHDKGATASSVLWNHYPPTVTTYTVYGNNGINFSQGITLSGTSIGQPDGSSLNCLSCHDGEVAIGYYGGMSHDITNTKILNTSPNYVGADLHNNHPVSVNYNTSLTKGASLFPTNTLSGLGGTIATDLLDKNGMVQCTSCHDPHNNKRGSFLRMSNAGSALCQKCHNK